jgi:aspartate-semialdehyde dehydrogenase
MPANERVVIVGAASLRGKELNEALGDSAFADSDFLLLDDADSTGQLESVGEEVSFVQPVTASSFADADFTFFAGSAEMTRRYWQAAVQAGSAVLDLTGALDEEPDTVVMAPWLERSAESLSLRTHAVVPAHPASLMLALMMGQLQQATAVEAAFATILEPSSEYGRAAMDELHQQTVNLFSFQALPRVEYDAQVAFNATAALGPDARISLQETEARIRRHYRLLAAGRLPEAAIQLVHAPVFHGHTLSLGLEVARQMTADQMRQLLSANEHIEVALSDEDVPSNLAAAGQEAVLVRVRAGNDEGGPVTRFWLWAAADNLKLSAINAVACALEMRRLRPSGQVQ